MNKNIRFVLPAIFLLFAFSIFSAEFTNQDLAGIEGIDKVSKWWHLKHSMNPKFKALTDKNCLHCHGTETGMKNNLLAEFKAPSFTGCMNPKCHDLNKLRENLSKNKYQGAKEPKDAPKAE